MALCSCDGDSVVPSWCPGGASVETRWCLSSFGADTKCSRCLARILVVSCWWCRGGCAGGRLVVSRRRFPACRSNLEGVFWVGHTMHQVIAMVPSFVMMMMTMMTTTTMMMRMRMRMRLMMMMIMMMMMVVMLMLMLMLLLLMMMMITMSSRLRLQAWVRPGSGRMLTSVRNELMYFTMMLLPIQLNCEHTLVPRSTQQPGLWTADCTRGVDVLAACYCTLATLTQMYQKKTY